MGSHGRWLAGLGGERERFRAGVGLQESGRATTFTRAMAGGAACGESRYVPSGADHYDVETARVRARGYGHARVLLRASDMNRTFSVQDRIAGDLDAVSQEFAEKFAATSRYLASMQLVLS